MPSIYRAKDLIKALKKLDFEIISQKGSHVKLRGIVNGKIQTVIIPNHKEIARGTFSSILTQSNLTKKEIEAKL